MKRLFSLLVAVIIIFIIALALSGCAASGVKTSQASSAAAANNSGPGLKTFTVDELAKYNGKNGNPAYIAVDGKVYDVSNNQFWGDKLHAGRFEAGKDYSKQIRDISPHGLPMLDGIPIVGALTK